MSYKNVVYLILIKSFYIGILILFGLPPDIVGAPYTDIELYEPPQQSLYHIAIKPSICYW
jgi:hypothetical protein